MNMSDIACLRGYEYDIKKLSAMLDCPVIETAATKKKVSMNWFVELDKFKQGTHAQINHWQEPDRDMMRSYHKRVHEIIQEVETRKGMPFQYGRIKLIKFYYNQSWV